MVKQTVKTIITVLVGVFCGFVCLAALGFYLGATETLTYEMEHAINPEITKIEATNLGNSYMGNRSEDCTYYRLAIGLSNESNYGRRDNSFYFWFESEAEYEYYSVSRVTTENPDFYNGDYYIPAGRDGVIYEIIRVENGCEAVRVNFNNYYTNEEASFLVDL